MSCAEGRLRSKRPPVAPARGPCAPRHLFANSEVGASYHAWTFKHDGQLRSIPMMESGYAGTRYGKDNPDCSMKRAARVENYRGFVFASLAAVDLTLRALLGDRLPEAVNERARRPSVPPRG